MCMDGFGCRCVYVCVRACACVCVCVHACAYVCMCMCACMGLGCVHVRVRVWEKCCQSNAELLNTFIIK